jgi:hypothetical protein
MVLVFAAYVASALCRRPLARIIHIPSNKEPPFDV